MLLPIAPSFFFFNDTATTEIYTLSLHDALPICAPARAVRPAATPALRIAAPPTQESAPPPPATPAPAHPPQPPWPARRPPRWPLRGTRPGARARWRPARPAAGRASYRRAAGR